MRVSSRLQQATDINAGRSFYTLRKTAASEIEKIDPFVTSMFLAHSPREMKRHCAMKNWAALDSAIDRLGGAFCANLCDEHKCIGN